MAFLTSALRSAVLSNLRVAASTVEFKSISVVSAFTRNFSSFLPKEEVESRIIAQVKEQNLAAGIKVELSSRFDKDLGLDSLDKVELLISLEEDFGVEVPDAEIDKIHTVEDAVNFFISNPSS
nr:Chain U, SDAP2 [Polytomella sp. Pringsheim 198.80]7ARD_U Chain U, SDAP2 [Polytomella sp. Pringsheim 198.80]